LFSRFNNLRALSSGREEQLIIPLPISKPANPPQEDIRGTISTYLNIKIIIKDEFVLEFMNKM
jgi:hypothetical protein